MSISSDFTVWFTKMIPFLQRGSILYHTKEKKFGICLGFLTWKGCNYKNLEIAWENLVCQRLHEDRMEDIEILGLCVSEYNLKTLDMIRDLQSSKYEYYSKEWKEVASVISQAFQNLRIDLQIMSNIFIGLNSKICPKSFIKEQDNKKLKLKEIDDHYFYSE